MIARVPFHYIWRNLLARRLTTALTAGGMGLVVFVFATVLMLEAGLKATLVETGRPDNVVVIRAGSETEIQSSLALDQANGLETLAGIARNDAGRPWLAKECLILYSLTKKSTGTPTNVTIRGSDATGLPCGRRSSSRPGARSDPAATRSSSARAWRRASPGSR